MNELQIFKNDEFGQIRTVIVKNEPWFVGKDVAEALKYNEPHKAVVRHTDEDDRMKHPVIDALGREQETWIINESGLYSMILASKLESAKRFKHWVTSEILPTIRKTGGYQKPITALDQLRLTQQALFEVDEKITAVDEDLQAFKKDMPILGVEESRITTAVKRKGIECLKGKESEAYKDRSLRGKVYSDIYSQLKREFGVDTYKAIQRRNCDRAISVINEYQLPIVLKEEIEDCNSQMSMYGENGGD